MCGTISHKWEYVAKELQFDKSAIKKIRSHRQVEQQRLKEVFNQWKARENPPFTMGVLLNVLRSQAVDGADIADQFGMSNAVTVKFICQNTY